MKTLLFAAGLVIMSFTNKSNNSVEGVWSGIYESETAVTNFTVRFEDDSKFHCYKGQVTDQNKLEGTYVMQGDTAIIFTYQTPEGKEIKFQGSLGPKKTYVNGVWEAPDTKGKFFLRKQKIEERLG
jgi:hypothetical protein